MNNNYENLLDIFKNDFNEIYIHLTKKQKKEISYMAPTLFVRWYYSALIQESILSPSYVIESQSENINKLEGFYGFASKIDKTTSETLEFNYKKNYYSLKSHPVVEDMEILFKYFSPILYLDENYMLQEKDIRVLQRKLSNSDSYYVIYLFDLASKLNLFTKMDSLYDFCIQPNNDSFYLKLNKEKKLNIIIDTSCELCADYINLHFNFCNVTPAMIKSYLEEPLPFDDILVSIFSTGSFDLEEIWDSMGDNNLSSDDATLISSAFYMSVLLDRAFIYVFGYYLRLIRPIYSFPLDFRDVLNALATSVTLENEIDPDLFMPCTSYVHSVLGRDRKSVV